MKFDIQNRKIGVGMIIFGLTFLIISNNIKHLNGFGFDMLSAFNGQGLGMDSYDINILWITFSYKTIFILTSLIVALGVYLIILKDDKEFLDEIYHLFKKIKSYPFSKYFIWYRKLNPKPITEIVQKIDIYIPILMGVVIVLLFILGLIIYGVWSLYVGQFNWFMSVQNTIFLVIGLLIFLGIALFYISKKKELDNYKKNEYESETS